MNMSNKTNMTNRRKIALTGGMAAAEALRQINPDVAPVYPITPQTPIIEGFAKFEADGKVDTEIITVESEHSAMSAAIGASASGARTITATSSQGLALMNEVLYIASGTRLPILMLISARALGAPINIHGDHSDVMGARDTGWIQIFSENAQEVYDNTIIGMKLAEKAEVPVMVIMDGFTTSHSVEILEILPDEIVGKFVGKFEPSRSLLDLDNPVTFGPVSLPDSYFEFKIEQSNTIKDSAKKYADIMADFADISGRRYDIFEKYKTEDAEQIIVLMGSTAGTVKNVVDELREQGKKVGLLKIKLFRPFPYKEVAEILKNAKNVAVMDRAISFGSVSPLYSEIVNSCSMFHIPCSVSSYVYALGGRDIFAENIESVFEDMIKSKKFEGVRYLNAKSN
ncbi:MAG: pyruvate ferredoxin oxidoreductase, alpha subunit [Parcubacteria group bacterium Athens0714_25]|nr:MAG: pyruvate ferredoxin oxidoreductase, alpha subunit [Parcubacteria group bacterium Athens0714_25]